MTTKPLNVKIPATVMQRAALKNVKVVTYHAVMGVPSTIVKNSFVLNFLISNVY